MQVDAFFRISNDMRYAALYLDGKLTLRERSGLANASASESDKYEELIVNPSVVTLVRQRGNIDGGGVKFVVIRYGNFWQTVWPVKSGHVSLGLEPSANPLEHVEATQTVIAELGLQDRVAGGVLHGNHYGTRFTAQVCSHRAREIARKFDFDAIFYYVSDLERAIKFYTDVLGFELQSRDYVARFLIGGVLFELVPTADSSKLEGDGNARLCLQVDDIHSAILDLRSKGVPTGNSESKENGTLTRFYDPDGNEICLWQYTA